ncbi:unnamed protein product [Alternaria sp. RS040]
MEAQAHRKRPRSPGDASTDSVTSATQQHPDTGRCKRARPSTETSVERTITIHRVTCTCTQKYHESHHPSLHYLDAPAVKAFENCATALHGQKRLRDVNDYLEENSGFSIVIYIDYNCEDYHEKIKDAFMRQPMPSMPHDMSVASKPYFRVLERHGPIADATSERMRLSENLQEALHALQSQNTDIFKEWEADEDLIHPYPKLYYSKHLFVGSSTQMLEPKQQIDLEVLFHYLTDRLTSDYKDLEQLSAAGFVSQKHWRMLFRPDDTVVTIQDGQIRGFIMKYCRLLNQNTLELDCWSWEYDGNFFRQPVTIQVVWPSQSKQVAIKDLSVYPICYAAEEIQLKLRKRGHTFWRCRRRNYVNYDVPLQGLGSQLTNLRYMVDTEVYRLMHGRDDDPPRQSELTEDIFGNDEIPEGSFALLLPATINGYGFHNKKWNVLIVEHIQNIKWNSAVFERRLVLDESKKELVKALVTVHIEKSRDIRTDFMDGKGDGLIMLLHGGPGTGKTLTAESIAEFVQRPLYRVTCGDIGTDAESVEKYLESALYIGSTWDCVVLLDEADVFLEERTKMDLQRNALVSVFLRVLEYYDGILILTTNRIGTFDEAFKSRIQLALHYPPLNREGRWEVWRNFVQALSEAGENINGEEISGKLDILARHKLNGRQIRNTISTARQLAQYKKEKLRYSHVDQAVRVANEFEKYVTDVHGHDDEEYARDQGLRNDGNSGEVD